MFLGLPVWLYWLTIAIILVIVDIFLVGAQFILVVAGLAAFFTSLVSLFGFGLTGQLWVFIISLVFFSIVWIILYKYRVFQKKVGPLEKGWEEGQEVEIVKQGDRLVGKLKGDHYPVKLVDNSEPVEGERLIVEKMEGITLLVYRAKKGES